MDEKTNKIKVPAEKMTEMFSEKDYLVKLVMESIKRKKPDETEDIIECEAIGLLNHYAKLESEIYFVEKVNEIIDDLGKATSTGKW